MENIVNSTYAASFNLKVDISERELVGDYVAYCIKTVINVTEAPCDEKYKEASRHYFEGIASTFDNSAMGITTREKLDAFKKDGDTSKLKTNLNLVSPETLEILKTKGFFSAVESMPKSVNPVTQPEDYVLCHVSYENNLIFDLDGTPYPFPIPFNHVQGNMNEYYYKLKRAAAYLSTCPQVKSANPDSDEVTVSEIPHYNAGPGQTKQIRFTFYPTAEQMKQLWPESKNFRFDGIYGAIFNLDLLGLRAKGFSKQDSFEAW